MAAKNEDILQAIGSNLGGFLHSIDPREAVTKLISSYFSPSAASAQSASQSNVIGDPSQMKLTTRVLPGATNTPGDVTSPTPQPTTPPTIAPTTSPMMAGIGRNPDLPKKPMTSQVQAAIHGAAQEFQIPEGLLHDIGYSEGGFRADAANTSPEGIAAGTPKGLYQFKPGTWNHDLVNYANMPNSSLKSWAVNGQAPDINDPVANARAAAYLIKYGQLGRWDASKPNWGRFYKDEELQPYYSQTPGH